MDFLKYNMDGEIKPMIFDILRLVTMQVLVQFLVFGFPVFSFWFLVWV